MPHRLPPPQVPERDQPHTTRTAKTGILRHRAEGEELLRALISGKGSFAKRVRHGRRFQQVWTTQQEDPGSVCLCD